MLCLVLFCTDGLYPCSMGLLHRHQSKLMIITVAIIVKQLLNISVPVDIDVLVQDCSNSRASAIELLQSCSTPSICCWLYNKYKYIHFEYFHEISYIFTYLNYTFTNLPVDISTVFRYPLLCTRLPFMMDYVRLLSVLDTVFACT